MVYFLEHLRPHIYIHQFQDFSHTLELSAQCACNLLGGSGLRAWLCGAVALWAKILAPRGPFESAQVSKAEKTAALIAMHRGNTLFQTLPWNIHFCNLYDHVWGVFVKLTFLCLQLWFVKKYQKREKGAKNTMYVHGN